MKARKYSAVVFDLDGTLLNTIGDLHASVNTALAAFNMPPRAAEEVRTFLGYGYRHLISHCVPHGTPGEITGKVLGKFESHYSAHSMDHTRPYDGVPEVLALLKARGYKLAIVSNKGMAAAKQLAAHFFGDTITEVIGESDGVRRKPAPDTPLMAMRRLGVDASETLYVGDSEVDVATAESAGMDCLAVSWGFRTREFLREHGATAIADTPAEIPGFVF